jgi:hypothetical protein
MFLPLHTIISSGWVVQSYVIRILGIFSVEHIKRLCVFMFKTCSNSQLLRRVLWISAEQAIGASLKHKNTQPLYMFNRVRVLHLNRLKERTWLHSFGWMGLKKSKTWWRNTWTVPKRFKELTVLLCILWFSSLLMDQTSAYPACILIV